MKNQILLTKDNIKILVCCHKPCVLPPNPDGIFLPVQVGSAITGVDLKMQRDDMLNGEKCDNISAKNKSFCELTAVYWAWKNIKKIAPNLEYIGLNHYRRYFSFAKKNFFDDAVVQSENQILNYKINKKKLEKILSKHNAVISKPRVYPYSLQVDYSVCHINEDFYILKRIIHEFFPEYDRDVYSVMNCGCRLSPYNMNIIGWNDFDAYCSWLFKILFEAEKRIDISNYSPAQKRIFGYMAERLFNVWAHHNLKNAKRLNIIKYSDEEYKEAKKRSPLRAVIRFLRNRLCAFIFLPFNKKYSDEKYKKLNWWKD